MLQVDLLIVKEEGVGVQDGFADEKSVVGSLKVVREVPVMCSVCHLKNEHLHVPERRKPY